MTETEKQLQAQVDQLRKDLEHAHEMIAKSTYKLGYVAAVIGIAPDQTHLEIKAQLAGLAVIPKTELEELRKMASAVSPQQPPSAPAQ